MRVLIFHGYLLGGTGSNVYSANVAQALARAGHEVHLFCQDRRAGELPWVGAVGVWEDGRLAVESAAHPSRSVGGGSITAYVPDIGGLLPVYVADRYEGFRVEEFPALSDAEIDRYLGANVAAVREVAARIGGIDAALANHLIMGPAILARAAVAPYAVQIHGSALSYTVIPHRDRFLPFAAEGLAGAAAVLVGSAHTARSLWQTLAAPDLPVKTRLGPPGVDVGIFAPPEHPAADARGAELKRLAGSLEELAPTAVDRVEGDEGDTGHGRDPAAAAAALRDYAGATGPRVIFVGKFIVSKGCDLLLAAWPLVVAAHPGARLLLVGFGEYRGGLERIAAALGAGDIDAVRRITALGRELEGGERSRLGYLAAFLDAAGPGYAQPARASAGTINFAGRLEYEEVAAAVRGSDAMVVPSTFPEAFGMVAAEAAAAGVLPVCARHSGLAEVAAALAESLPAPLARSTRFDLGPGAVSEIADRLSDWLALDPVDRRRYGAAMRAVVCGKWSWEQVGETILTAAGGDLGRLEPVEQARFEA